MTPAAPPVGIGSTMKALPTHSRLLSLSSVPDRPQAWRNRSGWERSAADSSSAPCSCTSSTITRCQ